MVMSVYQRVRHDVRVCKVSLNLMVGVDSSEIFAYHDTLLASWKTRPFPRVDSVQKLDIKGTNTSNRVRLGFWNGSTMDFLSFSHSTSTSKA